MRGQLKWLPMAVVVAIGCSSSSNSMGPSNGGGGGGGPVGSVTVGNIFFQSAHNGTKNPAVDTVAAAATGTWTWTNTGSTPHGVQSEGAPAFTSSTQVTGDRKTYQFTFMRPGTYTDNCIVHGNMMTGRIVVQ